MVATSRMRRSITRVLGTFLLDLGFRGVGFEGLGFRDWDFVLWGSRIDGLGI